IVRHKVARTDGVDEFRRQHCADDHEFALLAVQDSGKARSLNETVSAGKRLVDDNFVGASRLGKPARADVKAIETMVAGISYRNELPARRLRKALYVDQCKLGDA